MNLAITNQSLSRFMYWCGHLWWAFVHIVHGECISGHKHTWDSKRIRFLDLGGENVLKIPGSNLINSTKYN